MKNSIKSKLIGLFAIMVACCFALSIALAIKPVKAEQTNDGYYMTAGAGVITSTDDGIIALEFTANIQNKWYTELRNANQGYTLKFGMLIGPSADADGVTVENAESKGFKNVCYVGSELSEGIIQTIDMTGKSETEVYSFSAAVRYDEEKLLAAAESSDKLTDEQKANILKIVAAKELTAIPYFAIVGDTTTYDYGINNDNARSIRNVLNETVIRGKQIPEETLSKYVGERKEVKGEFYVDASTKELYVADSDNKLVTYNPDFVTGTETLVFAGKTVDAQVGFNTENLTIGKDYGVSFFDTDGVKNVTARLVSKVIKNVSDFNSVKIYDGNLGTNGAGYSATSTELPENNGYYVLANDIDYNNRIDYNLVRNTAATVGGFTGTLDGRGFSVSNLNTMNGGIFCFVNGGTIKNISLSGTMNRGSSYFASRIINAKIENVYIKAAQDDAVTTRGNIINGAGGTEFKNVIIEKLSGFTHNTTFSTLGVGGTFDNLYLIGYSGGENIPSYDDYDAMADDGKDFSSFVNSGYWVLVDGAPLWKVPSKLTITSGNENANDFGFTNSIELVAKYGETNVNAVYSLANESDKDYAEIDGATITKKSTATLLTNKDVVINCTFGGIVKQVTLTIKVESEKLNDYDVFIQADGTIENLTDDHKTLLSGATYYDGETQLPVEDFVLSGLDGKTLGNEYSLTAIVGSNVYEINYMYVTKVIKTEEDLDCLKIVATETLAISATATQLPENNGYYVLGTDITTSKQIDYGMDKCVATSGGFTGTFDGRGHTIDGLKTFRGGIFYFINGGTIKNVAFKNATIGWKSQAYFAVKAVNIEMQDIYVAVEGTATGTGNGMIVATGMTGGNFTRVIFESQSFGKTTGNLGVFNDYAQGTYEDVYIIGKVTAYKTGIIHAYGNSVRTAAFLWDETVIEDWNAVESNTKIELSKAYAYDDTATEGLFAEIQTFAKALGTSVQFAVLNIEGLNKYNDYTNMAKANNNYSNFKVYWTITSGVPVWENSK